MPGSLVLWIISYTLFITCYISELLFAQDWQLPFNGIHSQSSSYFKRIPNSCIDAQNITSSSVYTTFDCQMMCTHKPRCLSFNFGLQENKEGHHVCELFDVTKYGDSALIKTDLYDFYTVPSVPRSCSHAKSLGYDETRNYTINPDASGNADTFQVFCDMRDKDGVGVTVVSHDSENRNFVSGCEKPGCYGRDVNYDGISDVIAQLGALTKVSTHCEQYIKYECYGSMISSHAWLVSRDGSRLNYWGGAPPNSGKCACGVAENCTGGRRKCNCNINTMEWHEDFGLLSYKDDLPITMLRFGDVTPSEKGYHTLGKLKCYGQA
ncbi:neurexin-4-like [Actinia tenebrosa]|uniref:Neurexin-4-like n=1 Tax=Actinia tenebrosa TaxID=6105 RepID=A0A6P8I618_ACTTE|nr:neurexin-4-like [Actinia tenebrosa]